MSISRVVGKLVLWGGFLYLVIQGCIVLRPARTITVLSTLLASLVGSCGEGGGKQPPSIGDPTLLSTSVPVLRQDAFDEGSKFARLERLP